VQRFEREIQVQARLHHPNIVGLYNAVRQGESIVLVMEYVEGESLQRMVEAGPLPVATAVDFASQVLCALAYAHEAGIIHRDVAPANIIITPERVAKLTDFGLARGATDVRLSTSGAPLGSPWYMSPEQIRGTAAVDGRTDIYAMGAVLHEMLTGGKLFVAEGSFAVMRAHVEAEPDPPSWRNPEVPAALDEIVRKALAKDPSMRFQKADEFRLALQGVAPGERPIAAAPVFNTPEAESMPDLTPVPAPVLAPDPAVPMSDAVPAPVRVRPVGFHPSRAVIVMALLPTVMLAGFYAMRLLPGAAHARSTGSKPPAAAMQQHNEAQVPAAAPLRVEPQAPAAVVPAAVVPPAVAPVVVAPAPPVVKPPAQTEKPAVRARVQSSAPAARRTGKSEPSHAIRVTGGDVLPAAAIATPAAHAPSRNIEVPEPPAPKTDAVTDVAATQRAVSETIPEVTTASPEAAPAKSPNGGSWFTRALGKVNPFRKGAKRDSGDAKAPEKN
jgi:serine/threonine-protein kinase